MIFLQIPAPDSITTPASALGVIAFFTAKHFLFDSRKNKREERVEEEKTQLLRNTARGIEDLTNSINKQIEVAKTRNELTEKLVEIRHQQNLDHMDAICKYKHQG